MNQINCTMFLPLCSFKNFSDSFVVQQLFPLFPIWFILFVKHNQILNLYSFQLLPQRKTNYFIFQSENCFKNWKKQYVHRLALPSITWSKNRVSWTENVSFWGDQGITRHLKFVIQPGSVAEPCLFWSVRVPGAFKKCIFV